MTLGSETPIANEIRLLAAPFHGADAFQLAPPSIVL